MYDVSGLFARSSSRRISHDAAYILACSTSCLSRQAGEESGQWTDSKSRPVLYFASTIWICV